jgi:hypothetical protein
MNLADELTPDTTTPLLPSVYDDDNYYERDYYNLSGPPINHHSLKVDEDPILSLMRFNPQAPEMKGPISFAPCNHRPSHSPSGTDLVACQSALYFAQSSPSKSNIPNHGTEGACLPPLSLTLQPKHAKEPVFLLFR